MDPFLEDYLRNLKELHDEIVNALKDLPPAALDWSPAADVNSINVLVTHTVGAERFWIGEMIAGDPANRDRDAEFRVRGLEADELVQRLSTSFQYVRSKLESLSIDDLAATRESNGRAGSVAWILAHVLKHTATHMGHVQLMRQMREMYGKAAG